MPSTNLPTGEIVGLFIGKARELWPGKAQSAISKSSVTGPLMLQRDGFAGDQQADRIAHGGPEKAVHHYPIEHMDFWKKEMPEDADRFASGCFGENVSTAGLDEHNVCLGDVIQMGTAKLQVVQGRQPCWKLNTHTGLEEMAFRFRKTGRTGWYYRVVENGTVSVGDRVAVVNRQQPDWPLYRLIHTFFSKDADQTDLEFLSQNQELSSAWRRDFADRLEKKFSLKSSDALSGT